MNEQAVPVEESTLLDPDPQSASHRIPLRWLDIDSQGHVYHAVALSLVDEGRARWFEGCFDAETTDYVIARVEADYHRPISLAMGYVDCTVRLTHVGRKSLRFDETLASPDGEVLLTSRSWVVVWDIATRRTRPMTAAEHGHLEAS
ncbi:acyl-CoA thioesterase [Leucobacter sp. CSA1]|uniref:Acyl-CoA thioesterase n=1 Tax=Leucobacter chromiisoli TaxID=2796471 RepID=A0A934Q813_9MICO|nr:acyl-CoA thioesterase [Leucobacter chromiisoli]MBK0418801.1 acyl-CoA thioesterase [Leucobacter chromiisoli]